MVEISLLLVKRVDSTDKAFNCDQSVADSSNNREVSLKKKKIDSEFFLRLNFYKLKKKALKKEWKPTKNGRATDSGVHRTI